jgi:hypothetical protein
MRDFETETHDVHGSPTYTPLLDPPLATLANLENFLQHDYWEYDCSNFSRMTEELWCPTAAVKRQEKEREMRRRNEGSWKVKREAKRG